MYLYKDKDSSSIFFHLQTPVCLQIGFSHENFSHHRCSMKKAVLKKFAIFTRKHLCWSLF